MAIVFTQQRKKQKTLVFVLIGAILITALIIWQGVLKQEKAPGEFKAGENNISSQEEIKINFNVLKNPLLKELQAFPEIEPLKESTTTVKGKIEAVGKKGRENPFLPY